MNEAVTPAQAKPQKLNLQSRPSRLIAYYALLFFFIFLTTRLLGELGSAQYNLEKFEKINQLIQSAFDYWKNFDEVASTLFALLLAFIFALPVAWVYTLSKSAEEYDPSLVQTIVVLAMIVTGVMIIVGTDLARAFGLVGVVAAVRFRNTLKDTKDAVYVFISVGLGMACGFGVYHIAVWLSVAMTLTMYLLWKYKFGQSLREGAGAFGGKGSKKAAPSAFGQVPATTTERVEQALERQFRLRQWVELGLDKDKKKPNAALILEVKNVGTAQNQLDKLLAEFGGKWQLSNVHVSTQGKTVMEYVGRIAKDAAPAALLATLQGRAKDFINGVEYLSLKGMKGQKSKANEAADDDE